jgi:hypothetical protein
MREHDDWHYPKMDLLQCKSGTGVKFDTTPEQEKEAKEFAENLRATDAATPTSPERTVDKKEE